MENENMNKKLSFTKDDILVAFIESIEDKQLKDGIVQNLLLAKIERLEKIVLSIKLEVELEFGDHAKVKKEFSSYIPKQLERFNALIKRSISVVTQIDEYNAIYEQLENSSFANANLSGFKSKVKQVFNWEGTV